MKTDAVANSNGIYIFNLRHKSLQRWYLHTCHYRNQLIGPASFCATSCPIAWDLRRNLILWISVKYCWNVDCYAMDTIFALFALCNRLDQSSVSRKCYTEFWCLCFNLNKLWNKQSSCECFETPVGSRDVNVLGTMDHVSSMYWVDIENIVCTRVTNCFSAHGRDILVFISRVARQRGK